MPPVLEEPRCLRRHLPLVRVRQLAPGRDISANFIDYRGRDVFLLGGRQPVSDSKSQFPLGRRSPPPLRLRHRGDQLRAPPVLNDAIGRLPLGVEFPMPGGKGVGRVEDRPLKEAVVHIPSPVLAALASDVTGAQINQSLGAPEVSEKLIESWRCRSTAR